MIKHQALGIFAKAPVLGQCKTRLMPALSAEEAMAAHCELVARALEQITGVANTQASLWVTDISATTEQWAQTWQLPAQLQVGADLGARMFNCLDKLCASTHEGAMLMGTDCPEIDASYIRTAGHHLRHYDLVLGPAEDGGYGLIGLRKAHSEIFAGIDWGTSCVAQQTLSAAEKLGLRVFLMPLIWDVDRPEDWQRYQLLKEQIVAKTN